MTGLSKCVSSYYHQADQKSIARTCYIWLAMTRKREPCQGCKKQMTNDM